MAYKSSLRGSRPVSLAAVHTAEGARTAASLAAYFYRDDIRASSHDIIDANNTLHIVPYDRAAWTLRSGNPISDNVELCAFARWTRDQWFSTGTVDGCANPRAMLKRTADWIRARCDARGLNKRRLTIVEVQQGRWGVIAHDDWTKAMKDGTHWDPGPGFPWDYVMALVIGEDDMEYSTPNQFAKDANGRRYTMEEIDYWNNRYINEIRKILDDEDAQDASILGKVNALDTKVNQALAQQADIVAAIARIEAKLGGTA